MEGDELKSLKAHIKKELKKGYSADWIRNSLIDAGFASNEVDHVMSELHAKKIIKKPPKKPLFSGMFRGKPKLKKIKEVKKKKEKPRKPIIIPIFKKVEAPKIKEIKKEPKKEIIEKKKQVIEEKKPVITPVPVYREKGKPKRLWVFGLLALLLIVFVVFGLAYVAPTKCSTESCFISKANKCMAATFMNQIEGTTFYYETNNCVLTKKIQDLDPSEPQEIVDAFLGKSMTCKFNKNDFSPLFLNSVTGYLEACKGPLKDKILEATRI